MKIVLFLLVSGALSDQYEFLSEMPDFDLIAKTETPRLDLVSNSDLKESPVTFDQNAFLSNLRTISKKFKTCLLMKGVTKRSFENCVGPNYEKVGQSFANSLVKLHVTLKKEFQDRLKPLCKESTFVLCESASDELNKSILKGSDPVVPFEGLIARMSNTTPFQQRYLHQTLNWLKKSQSDLERSKKYMDLIRKESVNELISFIDSVELSTDFGYKTNPFDSPQLELDTESSPNVPEVIDFSSLAPTDTIDSSEIGDFNQEFLDERRENPGAVYETLNKERQPEIEATEIRNDPVLELKIDRTDDELDAPASAGRRVVL